MGPPRQDKLHRRTPIFDGKAAFLRTPKRHFWRSQASGPDCHKSKPVVCARKRRANRDHSPVDGRGHVNLVMLSLIALAWWKQLAQSWQAASQPASQVGHIVHTTAFLVGTAFLARHSNFFHCEQKMGAQETFCENKI
jgi:hypothetical protein